MGNSRKKVTPRTENEDEGTWMWVSFAPESRLIIDFTLGPRKKYVADELIKTTDKNLSDSKPLFVTDGLKLYAESILKKIWKMGKVSKNRKEVLEKKTPAQEYRITNKKWKFAKLLNYRSLKNVN